MKSWTVEVGSLTETGITGVVFKGSETQRFLLPFLFPFVKAQI